MGPPNLSRETKFKGANRDGEENRFLCTLTTSRMVMQTDRQTEDILTHVRGVKAALRGKKGRVSLEYTT